MTPLLAAAESLAATGPLMATDAPAGGAELTQVVIATGAALVLTVALLVIGLGHRSGRIRVLGRAADALGRLTGMPGWAVLPSAVATVALLTAVFGMYWDVSLHIDNGRDPGPLANPSHYFILAGLFGIFAAGWLAIVLPREKPGPAAIRIGRGWEAPAGGVLMTASASFALAGFPLDDVSHRLFGQDVTLWGPTHLMLLSGAAVSLLGILGLLVEGRLSRAREEGPVRPGPLGSPLMRRIRLVSACGGLLVALSIFQGEFDFGVPQFRLLYQPVLIALAAGVALVTARLLAGPGAAIAAAIFFIGVRGGLALIVGPGLGETVPHLPLYLAEAVLVEAIALRMSLARPFRFGALAGAAIGSIGLLAEWGWSHVWMPHPWPAHIIPEALALTLPVAVAAGTLGAFCGSALRVKPHLVATRRGFAAVAASLLVVIGVLGYLSRTTTPEDTRARVTLTDVTAAPERTVHATVRFDPPGAAEDADWLTTISWQGGEKLIVAPLRRVGEGVYRTAEPIPVHGSWKSAVRLHRGSVLASIPVYLPGDPAIPAAEVPAPASFERAVVADREFLQRERRDDVPSWLWSLSAVVVLSSLLALVLLAGWTLARIATRGAATVEAVRSAARPAIRHDVAHV